ncbi:MAG: histidine phosphatase family protein [Planctomycetota bacterium]|nr:histidine phosphatase family protein [Planctomycetota bacterium]
MDLWLIRHAVAEDASPDGDDARRALTAEGRERFSRGVRGLARIGAHFDLVLHSPLLRAQETADLMESVIEGETAVCAALAREPDDELLSEIRGEVVALVGHEPWLSQTLAWLVFGWRVYEQDPSTAVVELKKGAAAHLVGEPRPGAMRLAALYPPAALRAFGRR